MKNLLDRIKEKYIFYNDNPETLFVLSGLMMTVIPLVLLVISAFTVSIFQHLSVSRWAVSAVLIVMNAIISVAMIIYVPLYCRGWWLTSKRNLHDGEILNDIIQIIFSLIFPFVTSLLLFFVMSFTTYISDGAVISMEKIFSVFLPYMKIGTLYFV